MKTVSTDVPPHAPSISAARMADVHHATASCEQWFACAITAGIPAAEKARARRAGRKPHRSPRQVAGWG
jgi:hypothetical protein